MGVPALMVVVLLGAGSLGRRPALSRLPGGAQPTAALSRLRGGAQPNAAALVDAPTAPVPVSAQGSSSSSSSSSRSVRRVAKKRPKAATKKPRRTSFVRDAATIALCLSAVGAVASTNCDAILKNVPRDARGIAWLTFGGAFAVLLYALVCLINGFRADQFVRLFFGVDTTARTKASRHFASVTLPGVLFAIGSLASMQGLPTAAG